MKWSNFLGAGLLTTVSSLLKPQILINFYSLAFPFILPHLPLSFVDYFSDFFSHWSTFNHWCISSPEGTWQQIGDEMKGNEMKRDEMKGNEMNEMKWKEMKWMRWNERKTKAKAAVWSCHTASIIPNTFSNTNSSPFSIHNQWHN